MIRIISIKLNMIALKFKCIWLVVVAVVLVIWYDGDDTARFLYLCSHLFIIVLVHG